MTVWPASLPGSFELGLTDTAQNAVARTQMDAGPYKQRARFTAAARSIGGSMTMSQAQRQTFETFYHATISEGAEEFDWADPIDGSTVSMRFVDVPSFSAIVGGGSGSPGKAYAHWRVSMALEILP